jgi:ABC-type antimicrobial peptide transport system permease subunit
VYALQNTFDSLNKLFFIISVLIFSIGIFICAVLLVKLQNARCREIGLLSALGFSKRRITAMIVGENLLLSCLATIVNLSLLICVSLISNAVGFPFAVSGIQMILCVAVTFIAIILLSGGASYKLVKMEPAKGLRA